MVDTINDALGTDIDPVYVECPVDGSVHDTMADASNFREATGWEPQSASGRASDASVPPTVRPTLPGRTRRGKRGRFELLVTAQQCSPRSHEIRIRLDALVLALYLTLIRTLHVNTRVDER